MTLLPQPPAEFNTEELATYWRAYATKVVRDRDNLQHALQRIVNNRDNKNWRKPEMCDEAQRALSRSP